MSILDIAQWVVTVLMGIGMLYLSLKKAPAENRNLNGGASESFARAASIASEMNTKYAAEIKDLETRLENLERKKYRITIEFTIGDPPSVGIVKIEPMIEDTKKEI